jgi:aspartyl aminopeptidase
MEHHINDLLSFLDEGPTPFNASAAITRRLDKAGFTRIREQDAWQLKSGGRYYLVRGETAVMAFIIGSEPLAQSGFQIAASHIDSPSLKIKGASQKNVANTSKVGVEVYGGPIIHTWLDRELGLAGKVMVQDGQELKTHLVNVAEPVAIIPNAAIHMNRDLNKGFQYNPQMHLTAILATGSEEEKPVKAIVAKELNIDVEQIVDCELYFYDLAKATRLGLDKSMISSGRLDNLAMTHAILTSLISAKKPQSTCVAAFFDHEEIGSTTLQGADSSFLDIILKRISAQMKVTPEDHFRALSQSFMISADMAHALHPSYMEKYDPDYSPLINKGPTIKINSNHRYASTASSNQRFIRLCNEAKVEYQKFMVRSDMPCGSTVGPRVSALLGIPTIDIGNPMWAMHSVREVCGTKDHIDLIKVLNKYYR